MSGRGIRRTDLSTIGGRLRDERQRLNLSQLAAARLVGKRNDDCWSSWEADLTFPNAQALAAFAAAGADVLFIVTGQHTPSDGPVQRGRKQASARDALAKLSATDRRALLLDMLGEELRA